MKAIRTRGTQLVLSTCAAAGLFLALPGPASAQGTGFEPGEGYAGAPLGVPLTGQLGWYLPVAASSDHFVFTTKANALGLPPPYTLGNRQFIGSQALGNMTFPRAQADFNWSAASQWLVSYDVAVRYNGTLPAADNLSSFSTQDSATTRSFIALNRWENVATAANWRADYNVFNAAGMAFDMQSAGPAWRNLRLNNWYRQFTLFSFTTNRITMVGIQDLSTGELAMFQPDNWYVGGGASSTRPLPTALRFFVGGGTGEVPGNVTGWDNLRMEPVAGPAGEFRVSKRHVRPDPIRLVPAD